MIELPRAKGGWGTVLIDPPWAWGEEDAKPDNGGSGLRYQGDYGTMPNQAILHLPIRDILASDAQVWLWTINRTMHLALHCLEKWGLEYKTVLTWAKDRVGVGQWLRGQTEHLLLGTKGSPRSKFDRHLFHGELFPTLLMAKRTDHSRKPDEVYVMLEKIGEDPKLELFARRQREGWTCFGNQLEKVVQGILT